MMKCITLFFLYCLYTHSVCGLTQRKCDLKLQPLWKELQDTRERTITFNGKWIHAGTITFRKKIIGPITLQTLVLHWHGQPIQHLEGSLYCTEINKPFLAIDANWISDSQWSSTSQKLIFKFKGPCALCAITTFHLMLTVPPSLELILKNGYFTLSPCTLPSEFQGIHEEQRILSFRIMPNNVIPS